MIIMGVGVYVLGHAADEFFIAVKNAIANGSRTTLNLLYNFFTIVNPMLLFLFILP